MLVTVHYRGTQPDTLTGSRYGHRKANMFRYHILSHHAILRHSRVPLYATGDTTSGLYRGRKNLQRPSPTVRIRYDLGAASEHADSPIWVIIDLGAPRRKIHLGAGAPRLSNRSAKPTSLRSYGTTGQAIWLAHTAAHASPVRTSKRLLHLL